MFPHKEEDDQLRSRSPSSPEQPRPHQTQGSRQRLRTGVLVLRIIPQSFTFRLHYLIINSFLSERRYPSSSIRITQAHIFIRSNLREEILFKKKNKKKKRYILDVLRASNIKLANIIGSSACPLDLSTPSLSCSALCRTMANSARPSGIFFSNPTSSLSWWANFT